MIRRSIWIAALTLSMLITACGTEPGTTASVATSTDDAPEAYRAPKTDPWLEQASQEPETAAGETASATASITMPDTRPLAFAPREDTDAVPRVSLAELDALMASGDVIILDVRDAASYEFEHAQGAINIPELEIYDRVDELPKNKRIVAYCT